MQFTAKVVNIWNSWCIAANSAFLFLAISCRGTTHPAVIFFRSIVDTLQANFLFISDARFFNLSKLYVNRIQEKKEHKTISQ